MGGGGSKTAFPPRIVQEPYPSASSLNNLSLSPGTTAACAACDIELDNRATTSSVKLTRDFGNISNKECMGYQRDLEAVKNKEMSFRDFFVNLQAGNYSRPVSRTENGEFCEQVLFSDEDAKTINSLEDFDKNISKLKSIRIRKVTGGGSFSSGTKAKFKLSIPIRMKVVVEMKDVLNGMTFMQSNPLVHYVTVPGTDQARVTQEISVSMLTMYHPSPLRIENVQHDAILSINDPSDSATDCVFLIPLQSSNTRNESVDFFNKIAMHLSSIQEPDPVTGLYAETNIPTGNDWNIKQVFWLGKGDTDNMSKVTDAYYTWMGAGTYSRFEKSRRRYWEGPGFYQDEITYGWKPEGKQVRYYMLQTPVAISSSDLTILTRVLPPTPSEQAIHKIPDPSSEGNSKILYKKATGEAAKASCGGAVERMTNQGDSVFGGGLEDLLVDGKGNPLDDIDTCDPFKNNSRKALMKPTMFSPNRVFTVIFNILIVFAVAIGAWIAMALVTNYDYDFKYKDFSIDAGKVVGKLAKQYSDKAKTAMNAVSGLRGSVGDLTKSLPAGLPAALPSASAAKTD